MKSPRDILLGRHQAVQSQLNEVRRKALEETGTDAHRRTEDKTSSTTFLHRLWMELIAPARGTWATVAAAWLIIVLLNVISADTAAPEFAQGTSNPVTPQAVANWTKQFQLMAELAEPSAAEEPADRPRPHSERAVPFRAA